MTKEERELLKSGYAGLGANFKVVDRRENPYASACHEQKDWEVKVPKPQPVPGDLSYALPRGFYTFRPVMIENEGTGKDERLVVMEAIQPGSIGANQRAEWGRMLLLSLKHFNHLGLDEHGAMLDMLDANGDILENVYVKKAGYDYLVKLYGLKEVPEESYTEEPEPQPKARNGESRIHRKGTKDKYAPGMTYHTSNLYQSLYGNGRAAYGSPNYDNE